MSEKPTYEELARRVRELEKTERECIDALNGLRESEERYRLLDKTIRESEQKLSQLIHVLAIPTFVIDKDHTVTHWNRACEKLTGISTKDMLGTTSLWKAFYPTKRPLLADLVVDVESEEKFEAHYGGKYRASAFGEGTYEAQDFFPHLGENGRWLFFTAAPLRDAEKRVVGAIETFQDITDRKHAEDDLREKEERLQAILSASPDPMVIYDTKGEPWYINRAFTEVFVWTLDELKGGRIPFVPENQRAITIREIKSIYQTMTTSRFETQRSTKDGRILDVIVSAAIIKGPNDSPVGMVVNLTDISERKSLRAQYEQAQRMESIGTLAGGIAHDFNNLLMGIQGRASLIAFDLEPTHPHYHHLKGIEEHVRSASDLTKQLLGFARGGKYEVKPIDLNELVTDSASMFGRTKKEIRIHTISRDPEVVVEADRGQIEQVLLNLYINAWQAMPRGGELFIETRIVMLDREFCRPHKVTPGRYGKISVTDTGGGMDEPTRQRIFDPFFTTKAKGRGTGLGLASAYGIIRNHNGLIAVRSEINRGSSFDIYLPISGKSLSPAESPERKLIHGSETILLVDDEEMILDVGKAMLEKLGYRVMISPGGREAVATVMNMGKGIDLVILDMIMPGMDGVTTFDRMREIQPAIPVMLSSGYAINDQSDSIMGRGCNGFIQKPFNIFELSIKVRAILDR